MLAAGDPKPVGLSADWKAPPPAVGVCTAHSTWHTSAMAQLSWVQAALVQVFDLSTHLSWTVVIPTIQVIILQAQAFCVSNLNFELLELELKWLTHVRR